MDFAAKNSEEVREKLLRDDVPREVLADLMEAVTSGAYGSLRVSKRARGWKREGLTLMGPSRP